MYRTIVDEFRNHPRDVHTVPLHAKSYKWFYVFVDNGNLYVESGHYNSPKSSVKRRMLSEGECNRVLELYRQRSKGVQISQEAQKCTYSQVYWYGIFSEMKV